MIRCAVQGFENYSNSKNKNSSVRYYQFPKDKNISKVWISACGDKENINIKCARICSEHFTENDFCLRDRLLKFTKFHLEKNAVPSLKLPGAKGAHKKSNRGERQKGRERKKIVAEAIESVESANEINELEIQAQEESSTHSIGVQTMVDLNCSRQLRIMELEKEVKDLKSKLENSVEENLKIKTGLDCLKKSIRKVK